MGISLMESRRRILLNTPHIETASGDIATFSTDMAAPLKSCVVTINPVQSGSGDPSPSNVRPISGWTGCQVWDESTHNTAASPRITVSWQTEAGTVYGGTLNLLTGVLRRTWGYAEIVGTEPWAAYSTYYRFAVTASNGFRQKKNGQKNVISDYLKTSGYNSNSYVAVPKGNYATATEFKSYLAELKTNGTPAHICYEYNSPITYQLTPQQLSTLKGVNNIWADCGPVDIKYWTH